LRRSILAVGACVIAFAVSGSTAWATESSDGGGNANCSNVIALTSDQCQSTNVAVQKNLAMINAGDQSNNANQNNQPGGGNENRQQSDNEGWGSGGGHDDGGNANCSNVLALTDDQCKSTNFAYQKNAAFVNFGDQENNLNQNNQPGGGNSSRQQSDDEPFSKRPSYWPTAAVEPALAGLGLPAMILGGLLLTGGLALRRRTL
jgi:hypothetical protein